MGNVIRGAFLGGTEPASVMCGVAPTATRDLRLYAPDELGSDGYPPEWHRTIKHAVRGEAGFRCVRCLHPYRNGEHGNGEWSPCDEACAHGGPLRFDKVEADWLGDAGQAAAICSGVTVEARWRILTVHHLDGDKANCRWWNLAALCQRCHLTIQGRVNMAQVYQGEHSVWFRPYAAGYYAHVYLGEDLTRGQTLARMEELLALERAAEPRGGGLRANQP